MHDRRGWCMSGARITPCIYNDFGIYPTKDNFVIRLGNKQLFSCLWNKPEYMTPYEKNKLFHHACLYYPLLYFMW